MSPRLPPIIQLFICALLSWALASFFPELEFSWSGSILLVPAFGVAGIAILSVSVAAFVRARTTVNPMSPEQVECLITDGLYRYSRNPMYLGMLCTLLSVAFYLENLAAFLGPTLFVWLMTEFQIKPEERALQAKFGDAFGAYSRRTRQWI